MKRLWQIISIILAAGILCCTVQAEDSPEAGLTAELSATVRQVRRLAGTSDFNGYCGKFVGYQLWVLGIYKAFHSVNGNDAFALYKDLSPRSGNPATVFPGAHQGGAYTLTDVCELLDTLNVDGMQTYAVFCFNRGSSGNKGQEFGHVLLVHAVYNGKVYWCESFGASCRVETIEQFASRYEDTGTSYVFDGAIVYEFQALLESARLSGLTKLEGSWIAYADSDIPVYPSFTEDVPVLSLPARQGILFSEKYIQSQTGSVEWYGNSNGYVKASELSAAHAFIEQQKIDADVSSDTPKPGN